MGTLLSEVIQSWRGHCSFCLFKGHLPICVKSYAQLSMELFLKNPVFFRACHLWLCCNHAELGCCLPRTHKVLNSIPGTKETRFQSSEFISWMKLGKSRIQQEHDNLAFLKCEGECNPSPTAIRTHSHVSLAVHIKMEFHIFTFSTILHSQLLIQTQLLRYMSSVALFYIPNIHNYQVKGTSFSKVLTSSE